MEQEELISSIRKEHEALQSEQQRIQAENESTKDEVRETASVEHLLLPTDTFPVPAAALLSSACISIFAGKQFRRN